MSGIDDALAFRIGGALLRDAGVPYEQVTPTTFLQFARTVADVAGELPAAVRNSPKMLAWGTAFKRLADDFEARVMADPPMIYEPAHPWALKFHQSRAVIVYYRAPNRCSKTQSAVQEAYWAVTHSNPHRPMSPIPANVALVCPSFQGQGASVYEAKYIHGEVANILSPAFPEEGKWLNRWDEKKRVIYIACRECAEKGRPRSCKHVKSTIRMFSAEEAVQLKTKGRTLSIAGGQYAIVHLDEQIPHVFLGESLKRISRVPESRLIVSETPLGGLGFWTNTVLARDAEGGTMIGDRKMVELVTFTAYEAGMESKESIDAQRSLMSEEEAEARIMGRPASFSGTGVFNKFQISDMLREIREGRTPVPRKVSLRIKSIVGAEDIAGLEPNFDEKSDGSNTEELLQQAGELTTMVADENEAGDLLIYKEPEKYGQYVIGADVAQGLWAGENGRGGDYSCAQVLRITRHGDEYHLEQVAIYHGWVNSLAYALELFKLSLYYNKCAVCPERRGPGDATIQELKKLGCWTLVRDITDPAQAEFHLDARFGVDTNVKTKGVYISILQNAIWNRRTKKRILRLYDKATIDELGSYGQERLPGGGVKFRGESGTPDDRVMGLAVAVYLALAPEFALYDMTLEMLQRLEQQKGKELDAETKKFWNALKESEKEDPWNTPLELDKTSG